MREFKGLTLVAAMALLLTAAISAQPQQPIAFGAPAMGTLQAGDAQLNSGEYYDVYVFQGSPGQQVSVRMDSTAVDPYIILRFPDGNQQENDDLQAPNTNAGLDLALAQQGQYMILATTFAPGETGAYTLSLNQGMAAPAAGGAWGQPATPVQPVQPAQPGWGTPAPTTPAQPAQPAWGAPTPPAQPSQPAQPGWGAPAATQPAQPGWGTPTPPAQPAQPAQPGWGTPAPTTPAQPAQPAWGAPTPPAQPAQPAWGGQAPGTGTPATGAPGGGPIMSGQTSQGMLAAGDIALTSGEFYDEWTFNGSAGQNIMVNMTSMQFDTYLIVVAPDGNQTENDDNPAGGTTDSQVNMTLPQTGQYRIMATSFQPGEAGVYSLSVQ